MKEEVMGKFSYNKEVLANLKIDEKELPLLDRLLDYESAREAHAKKSHAAVDKRISLKEAISEYVKDGDILTDTGFSYVRTPITAILR
jgi:hypothetical protein